MPEQETDRVRPMPLPEELNEFANDIRDATFTLLAAHEQEAHGGSACGDNRVSHVAWIAHCLGVGSKNLQKLMAMIAFYEANCPCGVPTMGPEQFGLHDSRPAAAAGPLEELTDLSKWAETTSINFLCHDCRTLHGRLTVITTGLTDQAAAEAHAEERGWFREGNIWRCPECATRSDDEDKAEAQLL